MASEEYWNELFRIFNSMSDEEFSELIDKCEKEPEVKFLILDDNESNDNEVSEDDPELELETRRTRGKT